MKSIKQFLTLAIISVVVVACSEAPKTNTQVAETTETPQTPAQEAIAAYLELKDALVESSSDKAKAAAEKLKSLLSANESVAAQADAIAGTDEIEEQRAAFELVSMAVYEEVQANGSGVELYKQYCPMAFDDKGAYWLSDSKEIMNPYFGSMMLKCGVVQETIAAK